MRIYDETEARLLNAQPWQIDLLKLNPDYVWWGPHEDYMSKEGQGWGCRVIHQTWQEFGPWQLDELNECVNFYFSVTRAEQECASCGGNGYHPDAQEIVNSFYAHMNSRGEHWDDNITQDEVQALLEHGRLRDFTRVKPEGYVPTCDEVNAAQRRGGLMGHDAINRSILTRTRLERLGIPVVCPECHGRGSVFTEPDAHASLTLWMLHPRKGCSRGVEITHINQSELPDVFAYLREAATRNADRFSKLPATEPDSNSSASTAQEPHHAVS